MESGQFGMDRFVSASAGNLRDKAPTEASFLKPTTPKEHVVGRLRWRIQDATQLGFHVRSEPLEGRPADWCQIGQRKLIFLDLSVPAAEQLRQLEEVLADYQEAQIAERHSQPKAA